MTPTFKVEVIGFDKVKQLFSDIDHDLRASQTRAILDEPGKMIVKEAKAETELTGHIAEDFKRDLGVYRGKSQPFAEWVLVGSKYKAYTVSGRNETKSAVVAAHMTQGFKQTGRQGRGMAGSGPSGFTRVDNPVISAFNNLKPQIQGAIDKGILKVVNRIKKKYGV